MNLEQALGEEETERLWRVQRTPEDLWAGLEFESAAELLPDEALPAWPMVLRMLGSA